MNIQEITELGQRVIRFTSNEANQMNRVDEAGGLFPPSKYYLFFRLLAEKIKPRLAVVLGVCGGGDCYHLCLGSPDSTVVGVDIAYDHPEQLAYIKEHCKNFQFWLGDSTKSAPAVHQGYGAIDFLFIDTTHTKDDTIKEFEAWKPFLAPGAIVCFDDLYRTEMGDVWYVLPGPKVRLDLLHDGSPDVGGGFGVLIHQAQDAKQSETGYEDRM